MEEESSSFCEGDKLNEEGFTVIVNTKQEQIIRKLSIKKEIKKTLIGFREVFGKEKENL